MQFGPRNRRVCRPANPNAAADLYRYANRSSAAQRHAHSRYSNAATANQHATPHHYPHSRRYGPPTATATPVPIPPTATPVPPPTETATVTPTPEPLIKYVLAGTQREFNCDFTYIYGTVKNANNFGIPDVEVRTLGIHNTAGLDFTTRTDAEGRYEVFHIPLPELLAAEWAVMLMENGREVSERFHWGSTPACESDDTGNSQVLRIDWKLIE